MRDNDIIRKIEEIYGDFEEFEDLGYDYVCWIIKQDLKDIEEVNYEEEQAKKEFADIMINIIRKLTEEGYDWRDIVLKRLKNRMKGNGEEIVNEYTSKYEEEGI